MEETAAQPRRASMRMPRSPQPISPAPPQAANGGSRKPRAMRTMSRTRQRAESPAKGRSGKGGNGKKEEKIRWWQILLITLLVIALIFGGAFALIMGAITRRAATSSLISSSTPPKEFRARNSMFLSPALTAQAPGRWPQARPMTPMSMTA